MIKTKEKIFSADDNRIIDLNLFLDKTLKKEDKFYLRQGDKKQKNIFTKGGLIENGITCLHDHDTSSGKLLRSICTDSKIEKHLSKNYKFKKWKLVQTMLFDANPSTSLHTDNIFLDSNPAGNLIGVLIAFKDMGSENGGISLYDYNKEDIYKLYKPLYEGLPNEFESMEQIYHIRGKFLEVLKNNTKKPKLKTFLETGEIVSWASHIPHESLGGLKEKYISRFSVAAHYIPSHMEFGTSLGVNSTRFAERFTSREFHFIDV